MGSWSLVFSIVFLAKQFLGACLNRFNDAAIRNQWCFCNRIVEVAVLLSFQLERQRQRLPRAKSLWKRLQKKQSPAFWEAKEG